MAQPAAIQQQGSILRRQGGEGWNIWRAMDQEQEDGKRWTIFGGLPLPLVCIGLLLLC